MTNLKNKSEVEARLPAAFEEQSKIWGEIRALDYDIDVLTEAVRIHTRLHALSLPVDKGLVHLIETVHKYLSTRYRDGVIRICADALYLHPDCQSDITSDLADDDVSSSVKGVIRLIQQSLQSHYPDNYTDDGHYFGPQIKIYSAYDKITFYYGYDSNESAYGDVKEVVDFVFGPYCWMVARENWVESWSSTCDQLFGLIHDFRSGGSSCVENSAFHWRGAKWKVSLHLELTPDDIVVQCRLGQDTPGSLKGQIQQCKLDLHATNTEIAQALTKLLVKVFGKEEEE